MAEREGSPHISNAVSKTGDKVSVSNYRPDAILSSPGDVLEFVINN
jgi:hypothetical protein